MIMSNLHLFQLTSQIGKTHFARKVLALHKRSDCHADTVDVTIKIQKQTKDIEELISPEHTHKKAVVEVLSKILPNIRFLGRQCYR